MNKKQLVVAWAMGILYSALFIQGVFYWNTLASLKKNIYCAMVPITIIGGLLILSFNDKKWININRKQFVTIWIMGIIISLGLINILSLNNVEYTDEFRNMLQNMSSLNKVEYTDEIRNMLQGAMMVTFIGVMMPTFIIGGLLIYTLRDKKK